MPPGEIVWGIMLLTAIFYVGNSFLLRMCCISANHVGHAAGADLQMHVPGCGTTLGVIFVAASLWV